MNVRKKLLSGLLLSGLMLTSGVTAFEAIARETETANEKNIAEYRSTCANWNGELSEFSRRHTTNYGWFDFSDSRWAGKPVKEVDFWYMCVKNTFHFESGEQAAGKDLGEICDRIGEEFHKNWVYFPQFSAVSHEFKTEKIGEQFHLYSCRIVVRPNIN